MKKKAFLFSILILASTVAEAQINQDVNTSSVPPPGVYLTYQDFISGKAITPEMIVTTLSGADFYQMLRSHEEVTYVRNDTTKTFRRMWGYSDGEAVYLNRMIFSPGGYAIRDINLDFIYGRTDVNFEYIRVSIFGTLSLVFYVKNFEPQTSQVGLYGATKGVSKSVEYIFDTRSGKVHKSKLTELKTLIADDEDLLFTFNNYKEDADVKLYLFLKEYNKRNPFKFRD